MADPTTIRGWAHQVLAVLKIEEVVCSGSGDPSDDHPHTQTCTALCARLTSFGAWAQANAARATARESTQPAPTFGPGTIREAFSAVMSDHIRDRLGTLVHIEKATGPERSVVVMQCGFTVIVDDDGKTDPPGADWVLPSGSGATCQMCQMAVGARLCLNLAHAPMEPVNIPMFGSILCQRGKPCDESDAFVGERAEAWRRIQEARKSKDGR